MRQTVRLRIATTLLPFALCSCATAYVPPAGGETALLSIVNATGGRAYASSFKNGADCSGGQQMLTPSGLLPDATRMVIVAAGADFSFYVTTPDHYDGDMATSCFVPITFTPKPGATYRAKFSVDVFRTECRIHLFMVVNDQEQPDTSARLRTWRTPLSASGSYCEPELD